MPAIVRSYVSRHFAVMLDGFPYPGWLKTVDGGAIKAEVVTQNVGGGPIKQKHINVPSYDPITVQIGLAMALPFYKWIASSFAGKVERQSGAVLTLDRNLTIMHEQEFKNALVTEVTIPALDGAAKEPGYLTVKFQPETSRHLFIPGKTFQADLPSSQKLWAPANFRMELPPLPCGHVNKIDAFTIKQGIKRVECGPFRDYELEPTSLEYPNLSISLPMSEAAPWMKWHEEFLINGKNTPDKELNGAITFTAPNRKRDLLRIELRHVGISGLQVDKGDAAADAIKRVKIDLYVEEMFLIFLSPG